MGPENEKNFAPLLTPLLKISNQGHTEKKLQFQWIPKKKSNKFDWSEGTRNNEKQHTGLNDHCFVEFPLNQIEALTSLLLYRKCVSHKVGNAEHSQNVEHKD